MQVKIGKVRWQAVGKFDLRGLRGEAGTARFQEINLIGEVSPIVDTRQQAARKDLSNCC